jgi:hypothetical protein
VPVTPDEIADAAIEAAEAGAAIAHIHVRDPETGKGARDPALYRQVMERVRASGVDVVIPCRRIRTAPTWWARPSGLPISANCGRKSARSIAAP